MRHGWRHDCFHVLLLFCFQISGTDSIGFHLESQRAESIVTLVLNSATVSYRVLLLWSCWKTHREGKMHCLHLHLWSGSTGRWCSLGVFCIKKKQKQKNRKVHEHIHWFFGDITAVICKKKKKACLSVKPAFDFLFSLFFFSINDRLLNNLLTVACKHWV